MKRHKGYKPLTIFEVPELDRKAIGRRIRAARKSYGMTLKRLSAKCGIYYTTLSFYETGRRMPSVKSFVALATVLRRKLDWLLLGKRAGGPQKGFKRKHKGLTP